MSEEEGRLLAWAAATVGGLMLVGMLMVALYLLAVAAARSVP